MRKLLIVLALTTSIAPAHAWYPVVVPPPPPPPPPPAHLGGGGLSSGAMFTTGFIAFVAALAGYDIIRRWTCIGDPLRLGGPGFTTPMPRHGNIKPPPNCGRKIVSLRPIKPARLK